MRVLSSSPVAPTASNRRPISLSAYSPKAEYTSICRAKSFFSSALSLSQSLMPSGLLASFVPFGTTPSAIWRASVSSRSLSQPPSKRPLFFAIHSFGT